MRVTGIVQGVGFRPYVYRLALAHGVNGWVRNGEKGVEIHVEGDARSVRDFVRAIEASPPPAARIAAVHESNADVEGADGFAIRESVKSDRPTVRVSPDLPVCSDCLRELFDPNDRRFGYPYINCTNCGPRYSIILSLPYDRARTTMREWPMCERCKTEYHDPCDRRFHAQPVACPACGPSVRLTAASGGDARGGDAIARAAALLRGGSILAIKGLGGYHVACDARRAESIAALRERKYRKERPFALMVKDLATARDLVDLCEADEALLTSIERPIVLAPCRTQLPGVSPGNRDLGVMLAYTPLQHLLFAAGAPAVLIMTSGNRSSEPIAYTDDDALERLAGIADAFLIGERAIARRVDDSVARMRSSGPVVLRHARGYAPRSVAAISTQRPILCVGADLKSALTLVVNGQAFASQHIGDLEHFSAYESFKATIADLCTMYEVDRDDLIVAHDAHPEYASTAYARSLPGEHVAVQHHRAHVASVLAERGDANSVVIGVAFDGTGFGDDASIWGGEFFTGSITGGFTRAISLAPASLPGGDAAARYPVQAAAGFLAQLTDLPDMTAPPFSFPARYSQAVQLVRARVRSFTTTSAGRLFDTVAAILGFTREITFEAQAALWLEHLAQSTADARSYRVTLQNGVLDYRPMLSSIVADRLHGCDAAPIARGFHRALADGIAFACATLGPMPVVAAGGVFQNELLVAMLEERLGARLWTNGRVPCNDGGISLGQAALAAAQFRRNEP